MTNYFSSHVTNNTYPILHLAILQLTQMAVNSQVSMVTLPVNILVQRRQIIVGLKQHMEQVRLGQEEQP